MLAGLTVIEPRYPRLGGEIQRVVSSFQFSLTRLSIARVVDVKVFDLPEEVLSHCGLPEEVLFAPWRS
jgi:hypothetical protein